MTRYDNNKNVKKTFDGKRFLGTRMYPTIQPQDSDIIYISKETDYLDSLAYRFYKDTSLWWIIALSNNLGNGRMSIPAGLQLRIPVNVESVIQQYNNLNN